MEKKAQSGMNIAIILASIILASVFLVSIYGSAQPAVCGDGIVDSSEGCDDGNSLSGDGCSPSCSVEAGWSCSGQPSFCKTQNPILPNSCGLDMMLIIDSSGSINSVELTQMKDAYKQFVDAFLPNTPTQMAVVEFDTQAALRQSYTSNATDIKSAIDSAASGGFTNWQDALSVAFSQFDNRPDKPDLFVFASDGNPNRYGNPAVIANETFAVQKAVQMADQIKLSGIRIITLGIGSDLNSTNMIAISSPDALYTSNFDNLSQTLAQLAKELCGGTITVKKYVDDAPAGGWNFSALATGGTPSPPYGLTDSGGFIVFNINVSGTTATVDIAETPQQGHSFLGAKCLDKNQTQVGTLNGLTVEDITIGHNDAIYCEFNNTARECETDSDCDRLDDECADGVCNASYQCVQAFKPVSTVCRPAAGECDIAEYCTGSSKKCPSDSFKPINTPCEADGLFCTVDHCNGSGSCVFWKPYDCSGFNLTKIATCNNIPDSSPFTYDFTAGFTSVCNEATDQCTTGTQNMTHTCSKLNCSAQCETNGDCSPTACSQTFNDTCTGSKLTEYNGNKIKDSTQVSNSTANTCLGSCLCTNNSVTCLPPQTQTYCVKNVCGAACDKDADCNDGNSSTIDTCLGNCTCLNQCNQVCQRDGLYGQGHEFICQNDGTYDMCAQDGCGYVHANICKEQCTASTECDGYSPDTGLPSCTIYGQDYLQDHCDSMCHIRDDNCEDDYAGCTGDAQCDEIAAGGTPFCTYQCDYKPLLCYKDGQWGDGHEFRCRADNTYEKCNDFGTGYIHVNVCKYYCSAAVECDGYAPGDFLSSCTLFGQPVLQDYCDASCQVNDDNCESTYEGCTSDPGCDEKVPGESQECDTQCVYHYCGDSVVDPWEQCELPLTQDNTYCPQSLSNCSGHKLGTRDLFGQCNDACGCVDDPFSYSCVQGQCGAECDQASDFNVSGQTCNYNCDTQNTCGFQSQCSLQKFCTAGEVRNFNGTCSGSGCSFQTEDCDGRDYNESFVFYCSGDTVRKHRLFHDWSCSGGDCVESTYYVDDQLVKDCTLNLCSGEIRNYNGVCNAQTATCQYATQDCNGLDGTYCKDSSTQEQRNYFCTPAQCAYNVTGQQSCGTDAWTGGGNTPGFGADPSCIYTDYFCTGAGPNSTCSSNVTNTQKFDSLDNPSECNGIFIGKHDYWCSLPTCNSSMPSKGCSSGNTWYDLVCSQSCGAQCDANQDCASFCSAGNVLNSNGTCDLASSCTCSYQTKDCDDFDDDFFVDFHCDQQIGDIFNYYQDWGCASGAGSAQCAYIGINWKDGLKQDCNDTCTDTDGGINYTVKGTVLDNDLCSGNQSQCPFVSQTDFCVESVAIEYYCIGNEETVGSKDCNDYDCTTPAPFICGGLGTSVINETGDDYGCSAGACAKSGTKICNGPWTCDQQHLCQQQLCGGQLPKCFYSAGFKWGTPPSAEGNCSDGYDNDCDGLIDCADPDCAGKAGPGGELCCQSGTDCSGLSLPPIGTCDYVPDSYHPTWDSTPGVSSQCVQNICTHPQYGQITHTCNDNDLGDGIAFGSGCSAECDQKADCPPFLQGDICHFGKDCQSLCTCSPGQQAYCPVPGTLINSTCYYGERICTDDGCSIQSCTLQPNQICDPTDGCRDIPCNTIPPITIFSDGSSEKLLAFQSGGGANSTAKVVIPAKFNATGARVNLTGIPISFAGEKKIDIVVINDISGSMDDNCGPDGKAQPGETPCKINDMKNATNQFINAVLLPPDNKVGLSSYNSWSINSVALTRNKTALGNEINGYQANGFTCVSCGIVNGTDTVRLGANPIKALLLMTDGEANRVIPGTAATPIIAKAEAIQKASDAWTKYGIRIYAVAFGTDADIATMQQIAGVSHGKLYIANETNISDVYNEIAIEITKSDITSPYLDVGANGIKEWTHFGIFNITEMASGWHPEINSLIQGCNCIGCSLDGVTGECTIDLKVFSNSSGRMLLDNLSIEGCVYQPEEVRCDACQDCGGGVDCMDLGPWSQVSCGWSDSCDQSADCSRSRSTTTYTCNNPGSVSSYCSAAGIQEQENSTQSRDTEGDTCDDGLFCTVSDSCSSGICAGIPMACDDQNECTDDSCDEQADQCASVNDDTNVCGLPRDCPFDQCIGLNWTTYPQDGHDYCQSGACIEHCCDEISSVYSQACESDPDGDGFIGSEDACPGESGQDCNGCPNPCTGCAEMDCIGSAAPTCHGADSLCGQTICPQDGCGLDGCLGSQLADYPASEYNTCIIDDNSGTCTQNACTPACVSSELCQPPVCQGIMLTVFTDMPVYLPDSTVTISGELLDSCVPLADKGVAIQVSNSSQSPVFIAQATTDGSGQYTTAFMLPPESSLGIYYVFVASEGAVNYTTFEVNDTLPQDSDGDGVPDNIDACPGEFGQDCNGCPNPCTGCAKMVCGQGIPTCEAEDSQCTATACPADGCGLDGCSLTQMADYPGSMPNACQLSANTGTCTQNACVPACVQNQTCIPRADHVVFSEVMYDPPGSETDNEWLELYNPTSSDVNLGGFNIFVKSSSYSIPQGIVIKAGAYITIARNATSFFSLYGCYPSVSGFSKDLANSGSNLTLKNGSVEIDMVAYKNFIAGWSLQSNENKTISRSPAWMDTDTPADWVNDTAPTPNPCLKIRNFSTGLKKGWNLISIPVNTTTGIEAVLSSLSGKFNMVRSYEPGSGWSTYDPAHPEISDLHEMTPQKGYWINMTEDSMFNITGREMAGTEMPVSAGWNLIGYPVFAVQNPSDALSSVAGNYTLLRTYDPLGGWKTYDPVHPEFSDLLQLNPGFGYWIGMKTAEMVVI